MDHKKSFYVDVIKMVNFKFVEENPLTYNEFKKYWLDVENYPTLESICKKLNIGMRKCSTWGKEVTMETGFQRKTLNRKVDYSCYEDFKKDYLACELSQVSIMKKYNLKSRWAFNNLRQKVTEETGFVRKGHKRDGLKKVK